MLDCINCGQKEMILRYDQKYEQYYFYCPICKTKEYLDSPETKEYKPLTLNNITILI